MPNTPVILALALAAVPNCLYSSLNWSPDGRWLAFVTQSGGCEVILPLGWWTKPDRVLSSRTSQTGPVTQTLWLCQTDTRQCWQLARNVDGLSSAVWSPDGRHIAYAQLNPGGDGKGRCEIVLQQGFDEQKILATCIVSPKASKLRGIETEAIRLDLTTAYVALAWSPRGTFLAVPWTDPVGTAIVRVGDGSVARIYPDAYFPSWSPDERHLTFVLSGGSNGQYVTAPNFGPLVPAIPTKNAMQAAVWEPTGQAFHVVAWRAQPNIGASAPFTAELVRYDLRSQRVEVVRPLFSRRPPTGEDPASIFFARMPGTATLLTVAASAGQPTDVLEVNLDRQIPPRRHTLFDSDLAMGAPSFGVDKQTLALRFGPPETLGVPALFDFASGELRPIIPDHATRVLAVHTFIDLVLHVFDVSSRPDVKNPTLRCVRLPSPAAATAFALRDGRSADRVERLVRFGLKTLEADPAGDPSKTQHRALAEARMFLSYMSGDYAAALRAAESLEPQLDSRHERLALAIVRAQCYMGQRKWASARELLTLLSQRAGKAPKDEPAGTSSDQTSFGTTIRELLEEVAESER